MVDTLTTAERSERMSRVRSKDTGPELLVRRLVHGLGYRYRLHVADLPGRPDLVFPSRKKVIYVHGCFWHRHARCGLARLPKSGRAFWVPKLEGNRKRDMANQRAVKKLGWTYMIVWECQLRDIAKLMARILEFLDTGDK